MVDWAHPANNAPPVSCGRLREDRIILAALMQQGKLRSVIDRRYPLAETAEAIRYLETGRARGKVIVTMN